MSAQDGLAASMPRMSMTEEITSIGTSAALGMIPGVGVLLAAGISGPMTILQKRENEKWLLSLASMVDWLVEQKNLTHDAILGDRPFRAAAAHATRLAQESSRPEMQQLLAIAAGNSGSWSTVEHTVTARFMRILGRYDPENLLLLSALYDPVRMLDKLPGSPESIELHVFFSSFVYPAMDEASAHKLGEMLVRELDDDGLLRTGGYGLGWSIIRVDKGQLTSSLGSMFLDFCSGLETEEPLRG